MNICCQLINFNFVKGDSLFSKHYSFPCSCFRQRSSLNYKFRSQGVKIVARKNKSSNILEINAQFLMTKRGQGWLVSGFDFNSPI